MAQADSRKGKEGYISDSAESWVIEVKRRCNPREYEIRQVSSKLCIYRVPKPLMDGKMEDYVPTVVSFGPYHHKIHTKFSVMDEHKFEAVQRTLKRLSMREVTLDDLVADIRKLECEIRYCYEDSAVEWKGEILSWMFVMDACFVLEYLRSNEESKPSGIAHFSLIFNPNQNLLQFTILYDIIKLENQIPLFVLISLLQLEFGDRKHAVSKLATILSSYSLFAGLPFSSTMSRDKIESTLKRHIEERPYHLLDLYRMMVTDFLTKSNSESSNAGATDGCVNCNDMSSCIRRPQWMNVPSWLPGLANSNSNNERWLPPRRGRISNSSIWLPRLANFNSNNESSFTPTAELLLKVGVRFKSGDARFYRSRFGGSTLFLPQMTVHDGIETLLRNLMAFEECQRRSLSPQDTVISHYILLMEELIDSERDVSILKKAKIIRSAMGSDGEIADIFNRLGKGITVNSNDRFQFQIAAKQAREHYNSLFKVWINQFRIEHFSKPWYVFPVVAAILILVMTAVQTIYSVKKS